ENKKIGDRTWANGIPIEYAGDFSGKETASEKIGGFASWLKNSFGSKSIEGWFDSPSAICGDRVGLHVSGNAVPVTIKVFRMGYYGGAGARLVMTVKTKPVLKYPVVHISPAPISMVTTRWPVAWSFPITANTLPGQYLIRLDDGQGDASFVPITVMDPNSKSAITAISSVLTWQAYNEWGGYSLYKGPALTRASRGMIVSFNRPYDGDGSGQFRYMEFPILRLAEKFGIDLNYITDLELNKDVPSLHNTKSILYGGHGEYWTTQMRTALESAVARGINLVSFGGNAGYNRPRLQVNDRELIMWRGSPLDPNRTNPVLATAPWRDAPIRKPEALLLGSQYVGLGVDGNYTIANPTRWPFNAMKYPGILRNIVGREVDSPLYTLGPAVEELGRSVIVLRGKNITSMATYYTNSKGAGVLDIGSNGWSCALDNICPWHPKLPATTRIDARLVTETILVGMARGPLGKWRPAIPNVPTRTNSALLPKA
ncbi:MAG TPA: N,N-dimethylformamidase beta subunit family domain-containing protein, partial [Candidatus Nanopelagicaceae bacterium]